MNEPKPTLAAVLLIVALAIACVVPAQALAANDCAAAGSDPTAAQYCSSTEVQTSTPPSAPPGGDGTATGGSLPFTGTDLVSLAAVAVALISMGLAFQRLSTAKMGPQ